MTPQMIYEIFARFQQHNPEPVTELKYSTPFELLVAVVLSAQATDVGVNKATPALFKVANTPQAFLALGQEKLQEYVKTINLYRTKSANLIKLSQQLIEKHHGEVPNHREDLEALAGVGRKTANVVLNVVFGECCIAVDTHIFRVANRLGITAGKTPRAVEDQLIQATPTEFLQHAHHWLVLHGRYICQARKPKCPTCFLRDLCEYPEKTQ